MLKNDYQLKQDRFVGLLFSILLIVNLIIGLFPTYKGSFIWNYFNSIDEFERFYELPILLFNFLIYLTVLLKVRKIILSIEFYLIVLIELFYILSLIFNGFKSGIFAVISMPLSYVVLFCILPNFELQKKIVKSILIILLIWSISPILYYLIAPLKYQLKLVSEIEPNIFSFGGFAFHRNVYGFYAGITMILLSFSNIKILWKIIFWIILIIGLMLAQSRASLIATIITLSFYFISIRKKKINLGFIILIIILFVTALGLIYYYSNYTQRGINSEGSSRMSLIQGFFNLIEQNPLWGNGKATLFYSKLFPEGTPAHNFILQSIADYGVFVGIIFLIFIIYVWYKSNLYGRSLWLFFLIIGLVQPYFTFGVPSYFILFIILLSLTLNKDGICNTLFDRKRNYLIIR